MIELCDQCKEKYKHLMGTNQYLPKGTNHSINKSKVLKLLQEGKTMTQIAVKLNGNMNTRAVYAVFR